MLYLSQVDLNLYINKYEKVNANNITLITYC